MKKKILAAACCVLCVGALGSAAALSGCASTMSDKDAATLMAAISATACYRGDFTLVENTSYETEDTLDGDPSYSYSREETETYSYNRKTKDFVSEDTYTATRNYYDEDEDDSEETHSYTNNYYYTNDNRYTYSQSDEEAATKTYRSYTSYSKYVSSCMSTMLYYFGSTTDDIREYFLGEEDEDEDTTDTTDSDDYSDVTMKVKGSTYTIIVSGKESEEYSSGKGSYVIEGSLTLSYTVKDYYITAYAMSVEYTMTDTYDDEVTVETYTGTCSGTITYAYDETLMPTDLNTYTES